MKEEAHVLYDAYLVSIFQLTHTRIKYWYELTDNEKNVWRNTLAQFRKN